MSNNANHSHSLNAPNRLTTLHRRTRPMYICLCNAITDHQIAQAVEAGARSREDLARHLGVGLGCGRCVSCAEAVLNESIAEAPCPAQRLAA
jgi:bacterioferritin-associated ferredoxin